jgi:hypothetical protein
MKKLLLFLAASVATTILCSAQEKEKVVTGTISAMTPSSVKVLDEYISNQLYTGENIFSGWNVKLGAIYKKHDNLSWDLYCTGYNRPKWIEDRASDELEMLKNPSGSQRLRYSAYNFGYGTYYHWKFGEKLMLKAGGMCDIYGAYKEGTPDGINNNINMEGQIMLKAHAAIKYGWDFKKWGLDLRANASVPLVGLITADHPSEPAIYILGGNDHSTINPTMRHIFLGFYHNYMSLDYELGIDFVLKPCTISLGFGSSNKWWNVYDVQNIRQINYTSLGVAFDVVSRSKFKSSNKNF